MRRVLIGKNARVWQLLARDPVIIHRFGPAIGHREVADFPFEPDDEVWVLSYSRIVAENEALVSSLQKATIGRVVYFSSATTNIVPKIECYTYPRVKALAALDASTRLGAVVVLLGMVHETTEELPGGTTAAIGMDELRSFFSSFETGDEQEIRLFSLVGKPFANSFENALFQLYGQMQHLLGRWPCLLRPLDILLRAMGYRWYGYVNASNRLWMSTISSSDPASRRWLLPQD